jgi:hypothetical protein
VPVTAWEQPVARLTLDDTVAGAWLGLLDVGGGLNELDVSRALDWIEAGGGVLVGGHSPIAMCLGRRVRYEGRAVAMSDERLPPSRAMWEPISVDSAPTRSPFMSRCQDAGWQAESTFALLNVDDAPVVVRLGLANGGRALLLADVGMVANDALKDTEAGEVLIRLLLAEEPTRFVVDEYDHGFGIRSSLVGAVWAWARRTPAGWAMLHLLFVGLAIVAVMGVRFGPALGVVERHRRSPLEYVDALGTGLERARAADTAVGLIAGGLRRRLGRHGARQVSPRSQHLWIEALALSARTEDARGAVRRLAEILDRRGGQDRVLAAAHAVEDVWEALRPEQISRTS